MTLPLKNMDDQLPHPNKQSNQQQKTKTAKKQTATTTHNINNHSKQTTTTTKQQISTKTDNPNKTKQKSPPRSTYSTVLCFVFHVDCSPLFILWFSFCSCLFNLLLWVRQTKLGLNGEKTSNARRNKTKTNLRFRQLLSAVR